MKFLPRLKVEHPSLARGQIYISAVNWILCLVTSCVLLYFRTSAHMEAAYGLAITMTMLMTTLLLFHYLQLKTKAGLAWLFAIVYVTIEGIFFISSMTKFVHGGYVTILITLLILLIMVGWYFGNKLRDSFASENEYLNLDNYKTMLSQLSNDDSLPLTVSNLVMMTRVNRNHHVKREILYSILDKDLKRAKVYWFITVNTTDEPYTSEYTVDLMGTRNMVNVQLYLGFKMPTKVNLYLRQIVQDLMDQGQIDPQPQAYTTIKGRQVVFIKELLSNDNQITGWKRGLINIRIWLQNHTLSPVNFYGLEFSDVITEPVPIVLHRQSPVKLKQRSISKF